MNVTEQQLEKKFKHAADFGVAGTSTKANLATFETALQKHVAAGGTLHIDGGYRGQESILHVDPTSRLVVITDNDGNFVSGWRLSTQQLQYALTQRKLGGG